MKLERLRQCLQYDTQSGNFIWAINRSSRILAGRLAGWVKAKGGPMKAAASMSRF